MDGPSGAFGAAAPPTAALVVEVAFQGSAGYALGGNGDGPFELGMEPEGDDDIAKGALWTELVCS